MSEGLRLKYFVLNPTSSDKGYAWASCQAMREFVLNISIDNPSLAQDLFEWVELCEKQLKEQV